MLRILLTILCLLFATACAQNLNAQETSQSDKNAVILPRASSPAIVVLANSCPLTAKTAGQNFAPLSALGITLATTSVSTIAPVLVDATFDSFTNWLEERANELTASTTARDSQSLYAINPATARARNCIIFVRGGFGKSKNLDKRTESAVTDAELAKIKSVIETSRGTINFTNQVEIYAEFALALRSFKSFDQTTDIPVQFAVKPVFLSYAQSGAERNKEDDKHLIFTFQMDRIPVEESDNKTSTIFSETYDLGRIPFGARFEPADLAHLDSTFVPIPRPSKRTIAVTDSTGNDTEIDVVDPVFVNLRVSLTETEEGGDITRAIAAALKENKRQFTDPAVEFIVDQFKRALKDSQSDGSQGGGNGQAAPAN